MIPSVLQRLASAVALALVAAAVASAGSGAPALAADVAAVEVTNHTVATKCAEEDNVYFTLSAPKVSHFAVEARAVPYLASIVRDSTLPDFTDCSFGQDWAPDPHPYVPPTAVLYEDDQYILKGVVYPDFWRPTVVPVKVGKLTQNFLHLVQLWRKTASGPVEFLVFYPQDGYWRLKTLPPLEMKEVAYGSSFLMGPIETSTRPFVAYKSVEFDPKRLSFTIEFARGGKAVATVTDIRSGHARVDVVLTGVDTASAEGFAALRSMFVTPARSDAAEVRVRPSAGGQQVTTSIADFTSAPATEVVFGRSMPSIHNTSAPDIAFTGFSTAP
ncbi:MAG: hypothetical protein P4L82_19755 [Ancalomicrobiaceae bacterium]|nr:hypothetical protein [Ancalomicrobiaceae bacterium]